ncbi:helix-turn-helix domain-containing protein [Chitinophaga sp. MM2321]|uniref:helix-turn-helix domain-containing protein n=1 Tax=Chitinophaga sp. MM2321 TaxID=3137178 RepID=UPI0032D58F50
MNIDFLKYTEILPHASLKGMVTHYRIKSAQLSGPFVFANFSPIFQGLIFNIRPLDDINFVKKETVDLKHKVYFVGQAISSSTLVSSSLNVDLIAVNFTPTGVFRLTGIDLDSFTDQIVDAETIFGTEINQLHEQLIAAKDQSTALRLIDNYLYLKAAKRKKENKSHILESVSILKNNAAGISVKMLQKATNTSPSTLERSFKSEIGMTPKMYQRLLRFNQARQYIDENHCTDWWEIVVLFAFYDQSHFISEFRFFAGQTPMQYLQTISFQAAIAPGPQSRMLA